MALTPGPAVEALDHQDLAARLEAIAEALAQARADALALADEGVQGGEVLYELCVARRGLRRASRLTRDLGSC